MNDDSMRAARRNPPTLTVDEAKVVRYLLRATVTLMEEFPDSEETHRLLEYLPTMKTLLTKLGGYN